MSVRRIVWFVGALSGAVWGVTPHAQIGNTPPSITVASSVVTVTAGAIATNSGTYSDPNPGDQVTIHAPFPAGGVVTKTGTASGTWTWSFQTPANGPGTYNIAVEANDGKGGRAAKAFTLNVTPAPTLPPAFSYDVALPDPDVCLCLPPYMLQAPNALHTWWAKATGDGPLDINVIGLGVNASESGNLQVSVYNQSGVLVHSGAQPQPASGEYAWPTITVFPSTGELYRIALRVNAPPNTPVARHYRLKLRGAVSLGANSPMQSQAEHDHASWAVHAAAGETFSVSVNSGPEGGATSGVVHLSDPSGAVVQTGTINAPLTVVGAAAGVWTVHVHVEGHYVIAKTGGPDTGVYVNWKTWGHAGVSGTIAPASLPVTVELLDSFGNVYDSLANVSGRYEFTKVSPDVYTVRILVPGVDVPSQTVVVSCERPAVADFVIPSGAGGKVTAGVLRSRAGGRGGFNVQSDGDTTKGELQFQTSTVNFHAHTMSWLVVSADRTKAWFGGIGNDGLAFTAYVEDNGEPGRSDIFQLWVEGVLLTGSGALTGGNVQIHR